MVLMSLNKKNSNLYYINLFADFILNQIPQNENSIIQIADCQNFLVIKGKTSYNENLDISKIKQDFLEKFKNDTPKSFATHTIDLIEYDSKISPEKNYVFKLFSSENLSYSREKIEKFKLDSNEKILDLISVSEFPHGFSLSMGRNLFYYAKHLVNSIPTNYPFESLEIVLPTNFNEDEFNVLNENVNDEKLKSFFLDYFDFNYSKFEKKIDIKCFYDEVLNPLEEFEFVKEKPDDLILI